MYVWVSVFVRVNDFSHLNRTSAVQFRMLIDNWHFRFHLSVIITALILFPFLFKFTHHLFFLSSSSSWSSLRAYCTYTVRLHFPFRFIRMGKEKKWLEKLRNDNNNDVNVNENKNDLVFCPKMFVWPSNWTHTN